MFETLGNFSVVYFILSAVILLLILFEKQCLKLEDKFDAKIRKLKRARKQKKARNVAQQNRQVKTPVKAQKNPQTYRRPRNSAA